MLLKLTLVALALDVEPAGAAEPFVWSFDTRG